MKINKIYFIAVTVMFALFLTSTLFAIDEEKAVIKITGLEGKVLVKINPSSEWVAAKVGMLLKKSDEIKTLEDGKAHLIFSDKTGFLMEPNSDILVELPIVEPYEEPAAPERDPSYAPQNVSESQASKI